MLENQTENQLEVITKTEITSLEIAELTGKIHKHVLRDVRNMLKELEIAESIYESGYKDVNNQRRTMYKLPKDEALCLASGYSAKLRMMIIKRLNELEERTNTNKKMTYIESLECLIVAEKQKERLQIENKNKQRSIDHGFKSAVARKSNIINDVKQIVDCHLDRDVVETVRHLKHDYYTPRVLGQMLEIKISSVVFNKDLKILGYQDKIGKDWIATDKGKPFSIQHKEHINGTIRYSVRWSTDILTEVFQD